MNSGKTVSICVLALFFSLSIANRVPAQFINLQLKIEPELSASVVNDLNFGRIATNFGLKSVDIGDPNMGIFTIRAFRNQRIFVELINPDQLKHENPAINEGIPVLLQASVNNRGEDDYRNSFDIPMSGALFNVYDYPSGIQSRNTSDLWETVYIYVYGSIDVGNIPTGVYEGDVFLSVVYE